MKKKNVAQSAHSGDVRDHVPDKKVEMIILNDLQEHFLGPHPVNIYVRWIN